MKKTYISPEVEVIEMETNYMLAASLGISDTEVDTSNGGQLGREDKPGRPNVWEQNW